MVRSLQHTLAGRLVGAANRTHLGGVIVWLAYQPAVGDGVTVKAVSDAEGRFTFDLPHGPIEKATVGAEIEGVVPVDLEPGGLPLDPGDLVLVVDDIVPSYLRYG